MSDWPGGTEGEHWRSKHEPGSQEWCAEQVELTREMAGSVTGLAPNGENVVTVDAGLFTVRTCVWNDMEIPTIMFGIGDAARPMYFLRAYTFHPGTGPENLPGGTTPLPKRTPERTGRAFVVDTGWTDAGRARTQYEADHIDYIDDSVRGHGPAIVDLIASLAGSQAEVHLRPVGPIEYQGIKFIPIFTDPTSGQLFRGFDEAALVSVLKALEGELELGDVVNLSLGTVACPDMMEDDLVGAWLGRVTARGVKVAVAAGNHETNAPSWPAAYATGLDNIDPIPNVYSVGAGTKVSAQVSKSSFSAHGDWVTTWRKGADVPVKHPDSKFGITDPNAIWSGTSFATPICAAELLPEADRLDPGTAVSDAGAVATGIAAERLSEIGTPDPRTTASDAAAVATGPAKPSPVGLKAKFAQLLPRGIRKLRRR